ncbi:MAG: protein kinase [Deltaproteobacteria bacterium]|nr:protein kinase [Deltaproteobacteria bacterium]
MRVCPDCGLRTESETCPNDGLVTIDEAMLEARDPLLGKLIAGKYRIESHIGAGGMGSVYRARHLETGGPVAIKVMVPDRSSRPTAIKRFALEAQNAAALRHAHTVRVLDFGTADEVMFLAMEFLEGESLHALLERERRLPWKRATKMVRQVLLALWEAHEHPRRIVHRDIKPANILVCDQVGRDDFIKVVDFGVARSLESSGAGTQGAIGTPHAMAPEQWSGTADARSDLYAVGCLLYELVSGRPPFVAPANTSASTLIVTIASMHLHSVPPALSRTAPDAPIGLARLVHALLEKKGDDRPQSASAVIELLDDVLEGDPLDALAAPLARAEAARPPSGMAAGSAPLLLGPVDEAMANQETADASASIPAFAPHRPAAPLPTAHEESAPAGGLLAAPPVAARRAQSRPVVLPPPTPRPPSGAVPPRPPSGGVAAEPVAAVRAVQGAAAASSPPQPNATPAPAAPIAAPALAPAPAPASASKPAPKARKASPVPAAKASRGGWWIFLLLLLAGLGAYGWRSGALRMGAAEDGLHAPAPPAPPPRVEVAEPSGAAVAAGIPTHKADPPPAPSRGEQRAIPVANPVDEGNSGQDEGPAPLVAYRAHLSAADRRSSRGGKLRRAVDIVLQDRINVHGGKHKDAGDSVDSLYADAGARARLRKLLERGLSTEVRKRIEAGEVKIEVQVWKDYAMVSLLR